MSDVVRRQLDLLLNAYGYNLYERKNRARADDLLVRERAAAALAESAAAIRTLRTDYRRRFVPPPSRDNPEPPRERLEALNAMAGLQERLSDLESRVRGMAVPTQDRMWQRLGGERATLTELLVHDYNLIAPCFEVRDRAQALRAEDWNGEVAGEIETALDRIEQAAQARRDFLRAAG